MTTTDRENDDDHFRICAALYNLGYSKEEKATTIHDVNRRAFAWDNLIDIIAVR